MNCGQEPSSPTHNVVKILLFEDHAGRLSRVHELLVDCHWEEFRLDWVSTYAEAVRTLKTNSHDVCVIDSFEIGECTRLADALRDDCSVPFIVVTSDSAAEVLEAIRHGAADCLLRDQLCAVLLKRSISCVVERARTVSRRSESEGRSTTRDGRRVADRGIGRGY